MFSPRLSHIFIIEISILPFDISCVCYKEIYHELHYQPFYYENKCCWCEQLQLFFCICRYKWSAFLGQHKVVLMGKLEHIIFYFQKWFCYDFKRRTNSRFTARDSLEIIAKYFLHKRADVEVKRFFNLNSERKQLR